MLFREIIGQQEIKSRLRNLVSEDRTPHALMLFGPPGTGKRSLALAMTRYLACLDRGQEDACGVCSSCVKFNKLVHPDLHFVVPVLKTQKVSKDPVTDHIDLSVEGRDKEALLNSLDGYLNLYGRDLLLYGIDLDEVIKKFKRSQNFNLVDLGAVMFAGPAGLALTKGGSYAAMLVTNFGDTSHVTEMVSDWEFKNGTILLRDVAFATEESRVAAKGWLDFQKDSLDISFAVIDKKGCNVIGQDLYGSTANPEKSNIQLISTLLAPVTNLLELTLGIECEAFYEGRIKHPDKK